MKGCFWWKELACELQTKLRGSLEWICEEKQPPSLALHGLRPGLLQYGSIRYLKIHLEGFHN